MKRFLPTASALVAFAAFGAAGAADMPVKAPPLAPVAAVYNWTGFYIGVNAGYTWNNDSVNVLTVPTFINTGAVTPLGATAGPAVAAGATGNFGVSSRGFIGGAQAGYNYRSGNIVAGIEADFQGVASNGGSAIVTTVTPRTGFFPPNTAVTTVAVTQRLNDLGTLRGRFGFLAKPTMWLYATGGLAYGGVQSSTSIAAAENPNTGTDPAAGFGSISTVRVGWAAGAGAEWAFARNWSVKAEYLYYDLGTVSYGSSPLTGILTGASTINFIDASSSSIRFNGHIVRVGLNYKFDWAAPAAVVTRY